MAADWVTPPLTHPPNRKEIYLEAIAQHITPFQRNMSFNPVQNGAHCFLNLPVFSHDVTWEKE